MPGLPATDLRPLTKATLPRPSAWSAVSAVKKGVYSTLTPPAALKAMACRRTPENLVLVVEIAAVFGFNYGLINTGVNVASHLCNADSAR